MSFNFSDEQDSLGCRGAAQLGNFTHHPTFHRSSRGIPVSQCHLHKITEFSSSDAARGVQRSRTTVSSPLLLFLLQALLQSLVVEDKHLSLIHFNVRSETRDGGVKQKAIHSAVS